MSGLRLDEITAETLSPVLNLRVTEPQQRFVAPNAVSIAQAHFEPAAWFRAIVEGETIVGFAMLFDHTQPGAERPPELPPEMIQLWRFMVDSGAQGRGLGRRALDLLADHARSRPGITTFATTYNAAEDGPRRFYRRCGFAETGRILDGEIEAVRPL